MPISNSILAGLFWTKLCYGWSRKEEGWKMVEVLIEAEFLYLLGPTTTSRNILISRID